MPGLALSRVSGCPSVHPVSEEVMGCLEADSYYDPPQAVG